MARKSRGKAVITTVDRSPSQECSERRAVRTQVVRTSIFGRQRVVR